MGLDMRDEKGEVGCQSVTTTRRFHDCLTNLNVVGAQSDRIPFASPFHDAVAFFIAPATTASSPFFFFSSVLCHGTSLEKA